MVARALFTSPQRLDGPFPIERSDIGPLNTLFSEAFTERYRRDGLVGTAILDGCRSGLQTLVVS